VTSVPSGTPRVACTASQVADSLAVRRGDPGCGLDERAEGQPGWHRLRRRHRLYLSEPLLAWLPSQLRAGIPAPDMTRLSEMTIVITMAHAIDDTEEGRWLAGDTIGHARTGSGNEVDLAPSTSDPPVRTR
jgi:hypothetical protein